MVNKKDNKKDLQVKDNLKQIEEDKDNNLFKSITSSFKQKYVLGITFITIILFIVILFISLNNLEATQYTQILLGLVLLSLFGLGITFNLIKKTIGFNFLILLYRAFRLKKKGYGLVKEYKLSGMPKYHLVKYQDIITYKTTKDDKNATGVLIYNPYARYEDFGANIPVIEGSLNDISPKNVFTGSRIGMNPDLIDKIIVEASITPKELDDVKKHRKVLLWLVGIILVAVVIGFDLYGQRLAEANQQAIACYSKFSGQAVINASVLLLGMLKRK